MNRALLVGVNEYATQSRLAGCVNDVLGVQRLLTSQRSVDPANITILTNSDATKSELVDSLIEMVDALERGDHGYFHFSGYSVCMDLHDLDGMNDVLCPHDFDWRPETALSDSELRAIVEPLCLDARLLLSVNAYHSPHLARGLRLLDIVQEPQHASFNFSDPSSEATCSSASSHRRYR